MLQEIQRRLPAATSNVKMAEHASQLVTRKSNVLVLAGIVALAVNFEYRLVGTLATGQQTMVASTTQWTAMKGA